MKFHQARRTKTVGASLALILAAAVLAAPTYKVINKIKIGGLGRWDYVFVDSANHRLYVSHGTQTEVIDTATEKVVGTIAGHERRAWDGYRSRPGKGIHQRWRATTTSRCSTSRR